MSPPEVLGACVPVSEDPHPGARRAHYDQVPCPRCEQLMWLGPRVKASGVEAICVTCLLKAGQIRQNVVMHTLATGEMHVLRKKD